MTATATLSRINNGAREACLEIEWSGGFAGCLITVGAMMGGTFASEEAIRAMLLRRAEDRARYEAQTHGFTVPAVVWGS
jgi:hypothetical protein